MARQYSKISSELANFIGEQKMFFVGTAAAEGRVNISPKGMDSLRIMDSNRVVWINVTGSGNETAAHVQQSSRMTLMFCAFEGKPRILRLYGRAHAIHQSSPEWEKLLSLFDHPPGPRQIFDLDVDLVQVSCGWGVPLFSYQGERDLLSPWATKLGEQGIKKFWAEYNQYSLDGVPTRVLEQGGELSFNPTAQRLRRLVPAPLRALASRYLKR